MNRTSEQKGLSCILSTSEKGGGACVRNVTRCTQLKSSLVSVCVRCTSVLLLTSVPVIPWSHDVPSQITVAKQHPPAIPLSPPLWSVQQCSHGWRGCLKRAKFIFRSRGKRRGITRCSKIKLTIPPPSPSLLSSFFSSLPVFLYLSFPVCSFIDAVRRKLR